MKKIKLFFLSIVSIAFATSFQVMSPLTAFATNSSTGYGYMKCLSSCLLFKTSDITDMSLDNLYFVVPEGYFVKKVKDISETTIEVTYNGKTGFVMSERVTSVDFLPKTKYLQNITFDISSYSGTQLWNKPTTSGSSNILVKHIPAGTKHITYVADIRGEIPAGSTSPVWYYCYYSPASDPTSVFEGYIHSEKTTSLSVIPPNTEGNPQPPLQNETNTNQAEITTRGTVEIILIALIALPILTIIVLLFLSSKRKDKQDAITHEMERMANDKDIAPITRENHKKGKISDFKNKRFSLKNSFENFMYTTPPETSKMNINFDPLDEIDDDDLL